MTNSQGIFTQISYVAETDYGQTPASPSMTALDFTTSSLNFTKQTHSDDSIVGDRMRRNTGHGNTVSSGDIGINFKYAEYDAFFEGLLSGGFSSNVLKPGLTRKSFTIEEASKDIAQYRKFTGALVNTFALTIPLQGYLSATLSMMAQGHAISGTPLDDDVTAPTVGAPYFHGIAAFQEGGSDARDLLSNLTLKIDNGLTAQYALGNTSPVDFSSSWIDVSGTIEPYFADANIYNKFVNGSGSSLDVILQDDAGNSFEIFIPNIQYSGASKNISGTGFQTFAMPFTARFDVSTSANIVITRTPA